MRMRMQQDGGNQALAWPSRGYERQENAVIAGLANGEWLLAVYKRVKDRIGAFKSSGFEERVSKTSTKR
jgi:hypothetical protein